MRQIILVVTFAILLLLLAFQSLIAWDVRSVRDSLQANMLFVRDAAIVDCLSREAIVKTAESRGWKYEPDPFWQNEDTNNSLKTPLRVYVEPQMNFAKLPGVQFRFDHRGCLIKK